MTDQRKDPTHVLFAELAYPGLFTDLRHLDLKASLKNPPLGDNWSSLYNLQAVPPESVHSPALFVALKLCAGPCESQAFLVP